MSPSLFAICLIPPTQILRKVTSGYTLNIGDNLNHQFMNDRKVFRKCARDVNASISSVQLFSKDTEMVLGKQRIKSRAEYSQKRKK